MPFDQRAASSPLQVRCGLARHVHKHRAPALLQSSIPRAHVPTMSSTATVVDELGLVQQCDATSSRSTVDSLSMRLLHTQHAADEPPPARPRVGQAGACANRTDLTILQHR
ncbi:hypothetical protein FKW77_000339 [Venturia effusa]|uniref:Uncharacterized protein n=1 Tax=Venturia effusa TaxID=50376 RepID=A0A517LM20_9PEZI|nr:hypothetical protein FKW77_000339 [Venturia effusa]